jgi:hypothetical protein
MIWAIEERSPPSEEDKQEIEKLRKVYLYIEGTAGPQKLAQYVMRNNSVLAVTLALLRQEILFLEEKDTAMRECHLRIQKYDM